MVQWWNEKHHQWWNGAILKCAYLPETHLMNFVFFLSNWTNCFRWRYSVISYGATITWNNLSISFLSPAWYSTPTTPVLTTDATFFLNYSTLIGFLHNYLLLVIFTYFLFFFIFLVNLTFHSYHNCSCHCYYLITWTFHHF